MSINVLFLSEISLRIRSWHNVIILHSLFYAKTTSEMTYPVSGGALNSTQSNNQLSILYLIFDPPLVFSKG